MTSLDLLKKRINSLKGEGTSIRTLYFLAYASGASWYPLFNVYLKERGLTGIQIGTIASILPALYFISQPFWGMGADRWGRQRTLLATILLSSIVMVGFVWHGDFWYFFIWTIIFATFFNPVAPLIDSLTLDYVEMSGKSSYGLLRMWGAIGWACFAPLVGYIISGRDMSLIFPIGAAMLLLSWLVGYKTKRIEGDSEAMQASWQNLGAVFRNFHLLIFLVMTFVLSIGAASIWTFYGVYLDDIGAPRQLIGIAFSIQGISEIPFYLISTAILKRLGPIKTLIITFFVTAIRVFLYSIISVPFAAAAVEVIHGLSYALFIVAAVEYVNMLVPSAWRATGQSLFWASYFGAGAILGNTWAGFLYDRMNIQTMYQVNGWIILTVSLIAIVVFREHRMKEAKVINNERKL